MQNGEHLAKIPEINMNRYRFTHIETLYFDKEATQEWIELKQIPEITNAKDIK